MEHLNRLNQKLIYAMKRNEDKLQKGIKITKILTKNVSFKYL